MPTCMAKGSNKTDEVVDELEYLFPWEPHSHYRAIEISDEGDDDRGARADAFRPAACDGAQPFREEGVRSCRLFPQPR